MFYLYQSIKEQRVKIEILKNSFKSAYLIIFSLSFLWLNFNNYLLSISCLLSYFVTGATLRNQICNWYLLSLYYVPQTILSTLYILMTVILTTTHWEWRTPILSILQVRKPKSSEAKSLTLGHTDIKWQSQARLAQALTVLPIIVSIVPAVKELSFLGKQKVKRIAFNK